MIKIARHPEPAKLATTRTSQLIALRSLGRDPTSNDIEGYRIVAEELWKAQHHKCCYCEIRIPKGYNDVEHYRPKAVADRTPGCSETHGYWWLAFTWDNLLFACPDCNRSHKNTKFPLDYSCQPLMPEELPPGNEIPLLIDPCSAVNPVEHIEFVYQSIGPASTPSTWWARPRNGSIIGNETINVCGLNRADLREIREDHYSTVILKHSYAIESAIIEADTPRIQREFNRAIELLNPRNVHVGLTYDAFRHTIPDTKLIASMGIGWPAPNLIAV